MEKIRQSCYVEAATAIIRLFGSMYVFVFLVSYQNYGRIAPELLAIFVPSVMLGWGCKAL